jgi:uncharacterized membrane protein YkvA (DUF1232 family)
MSDDNHNQPPNEYLQHYSEDGFWEKVGSAFMAAGQAFGEIVLKLYYAAQDPDTPMWAKSTIYTALGYFIFPVDAIPDITPMVGYLDDLGVLTIAVATVAAHIKDEHVAKAKETLKRWFH